MAAEARGTSNFTSRREPNTSKLVLCLIAAGAGSFRGWGLVIDFHGMIRASTRADHEQVDALFGTFDLASAPSYGAMLLAHARALLPIEAWMAGGGVPLWEARGAALCEDLSALGLAPPSADALHWPSDEPAHWGTAYVLEGSRLGGAFIARQLPEGLPRAYLTKAHGPGHWKAFLAELDERASLRSPGWREDAIAAAQRAFETFAEAARFEASSR